MVARAGIGARLQMLRNMTSANVLMNLFIEICPSIWIAYSRNGLPGPAVVPTTV